MNEALFTLTNFIFVSLILIADWTCEPATWYPEDEHATDNFSMLTVFICVV